MSDLNVGRLQGDAAREQRARAALRAWIRQSFGLDLAGVRLSRRGCVKR